MIDGGRRPTVRCGWRGIHLHVGSQLGAVDAGGTPSARGLALLALVGAGSTRLRHARRRRRLPGRRDPGEPVADPGPVRRARCRPLLDALPARPAARPAGDRARAGSSSRAPAGWSRGCSTSATRAGARSWSSTPGMTELIRPGPVRRPPPDRRADLARPPIDDAGRDRRAGVATPTRVSTARSARSTDTLGDATTCRRCGAATSSRSARPGRTPRRCRSTYNGRPRPPQVLLEADGALTVGRRRGTTVR